MSSCLWATEAARRKRKQPLFPGSARFNASELHFDVQKTHEGVSTIELKISPLASGLNLVIDLINSGDKDAVLRQVEEMASVKLESVPVETSMDESSTRLWSNGGSVTPEASLLKVKSERLDSNLQLSQATRSEVEDAHNKELIEREVSLDERALDEDQDKNELEEELNLAIKREKFMLHESNVGTDVLNQTTTHSAQNHSSRTLSIPAADDVPPNLESNKAIEGRLNSKVIESFQDQVPHLPQSSPKPELHHTTNLEQSRVTEQKHTNLSEYLPKEQTKTVRVKMEESDSEISDTSFQAISSAIRKSFAGRVSMSNANDQGLLHTPGQPRTEPQAISKSSNGKVGNIGIKKESDEFRLGQLSNANLSLSSKPSAPLAKRISKRTSVFVSLPSREPITYQPNKRHSIKVKMEESDPPFSKQAFSTKSAPVPASNIPVYSRASEGAKGTSAKFNSVSSKSEIFMSEISRQLSQAQMEITELPKRRNADASKLSISPTLISPNRQSSPLYAANLRSKSKPGSSQGSRTTAFGSPNHGAPRLATSERKLRSRSRSPVRALRKGDSLKRASVVSGNRSPIRSLQDSSPGKVPQLYSAPSSRSPTRYDNQGEKGIARYSVATSTTASTPGENKSLASTVKPSTEASKSAQISGRERRTQNKFLTTTLNPQNPPQFNPVKTSFKNPSPIKRFLDTDAEKERLELKERRLKMNDLATSKVDLQPLNLDKSERLHQRRTSPTRKRATSPVKRESLPLRGMKPNKIAKTTATSNVSVSRRRAAVGNAQPLPDAARGRFVRSRNNQDERKTPLKGTASNQAQTPIHNGVSGSPAIRGDTLPDIPSDDESLKSKKYLKGWANTPELQKLIQVNHKLNPVEIFGKVSDLRMDEVFESTSGERK